MQGEVAEDLYRFLSQGGNCQHDNYRTKLNIGVTPSQFYRKHSMAQT